MSLKTSRAVSQSWTRAKRLATAAQASPMAARTYLAKCPKKEVMLLDHKDSDITPLVLGFQTELKRKDNPIPKKEWEKICLAVFETTIPTKVAVQIKELARQYSRETVVTALIAYLYCNT